MFPIYSRQGGANDVGTYCVGSTRWAEECIRQKKIMGR